MPVPTRVGNLSGQNTGTSPVPLSNPAGAAGGDQMLLAITVNQTSISISDLAGWTLLSDTSYNTRRTFVLTRPFASFYSDISLSAASTAGWTIMAFRASVGWTLNAPTLGTVWRRVDNGGSINTTQMPSVAAPNDSTCIGITAETSTGAETGATLSGAGWTEWYYADTDATQAAAVNYHVSYKDMAAAGDSGSATTTWVNNSNNSIGVQAIISQTQDGGPDAGMVTAHGCFQFGSDRLVIGHKRVGGTVHETVLYNATGTTEIDRVAVAIDGTISWGSAEFTGLTPDTTYSARFVVDDVEQIDVEIAAITTLTVEPKSFVAVTGSCMFTGSNHPVYDNIRELNPAFWTVQGDLHYDDATTESGWRAGMESTLTAARIQHLNEHVPMHWTGDNHDIIRTDPLGGGSPASVASWKTLAGSSGWLSADSVGRYWQHGRVLFIQTDMRSARDNYQTAPEPRTMLGSAQKTAFKNLLTAAADDPGIALVVWMPTWTARNDGSGRWNSYPTESTELENHINSLPKVKRKMVMVGGDSHVLQADSGARTGTAFRFHGIPSLNISGYNRSSQYTTGGWDIAEADLRTSGQPEADWGGYSRLTVTDDGVELRFLWEGVRVNATGVEDVMAYYERSFGQLWDNAYVGSSVADVVYVGGTRLWEKQVSGSNV